MNDYIYFFDSYAIIEIFKGNKEYLKYTNSVVLLTKLNLFEVYYTFLRIAGQDVAYYFLEKYSAFAIDYDMNDIAEAANLKIQYKKRKLSMADCVGYVLAKKVGVKFLTGDKEFVDLESVEFVK